MLEMPVNTRYADVYQNKIAMKSLHRMMLYAKDIQLIMGKKEDAARRLIAAIKRANNRTNHGFVTIDEFCDFTGAAREKVMEFLK
jgi:hypothetical protein